MVKCQMCRKQAVFNFSCELKAKYCKDHIKPGMIDVKNKKCVYIGCHKQPTYNVLGEKKGLYCADHALDNMCDVKHPVCAEKGCNKRPNFNYPTERKGLYCIKHIKNGMVNVVSKTCFCNGCDKRPGFNYVGETIGLYCQSHSKVGMVNVKDRKCKYNGCNKRPNFNLPGELKGLFCKKHSADNMIDVKHEKCHYDGCNKRPCFNLLGETKGLFCADHKKLGMVDVENMKCEHKKCVHNDCNTRASFNYDNETHGKYCQKHALPEMINVLSNNCTHTDCMTRALYGLVGFGPTLCAYHKNDLAHSVKQPTKKCSHDMCKEYAIYGTKYRSHCENHKEVNEINLIERKCKSCGLLNVLDKDDLCRVCNPAAFQQYRLAKQDFVKSMLKTGLEEYYKYLKSCDKVIDGAICGKERPDFLFDCGDHYVVLECDENQHKERLCDCEYARMINISQSLGLSTIFIRYNPDNFVNKNNKIMDISTTNRKFLLLNMIKTQINRNEFHFAEVHYLYYDNCDETFISSRVLLENVSYDFSYIKDLYKSSTRRNFKLISDLDNSYNNFIKLFV